MQGTGIDATMVGFFRLAHAPFRLGDALFSGGPALIPLFFSCCCAAAAKEGQARGSEKN